MKRLRLPAPFPAAQLRKTGLALLLVAAIGDLPGQSAEFYPLDQVRAGQKGYGKTVFAGTRVGRFEVEVLGVLRNFGPRQNMVLVRLASDEIQRTGVFAGMSGSPVYIEEKLVGALAYSFPFSKEPIAGITPISEIVNVFREQPGAPGVQPRATRVAEWRGTPRLPEAPPLPGRDVDMAPWGVEVSGRLQPIATPVSLAGFSPASISEFAPRLESLGLVPVQGAGSAEGGEYPDAPLEAGSTVAVQLVRGDMEISAAGTVTHLSGRRVYAFGHPFISAGYTDMPLAKAAVIAVIPSLMSSWKVSATTRPLGAVRQDRATGLLGYAGDEPDLVPVALKLHTSRNETRNYHYEIVRDSFLTPFLLAFTVHNSIVASERAVGGQTLLVRTRVGVRDEDPVNFENAVSEDSGSPIFAAVAAASPVGFLFGSGFENLEVEKIEVEISALEQTREARLEKVWQDRLEARPGEEVNLTVFLRKGNGQTVSEKYPIKIPEEIGPGPLNVDVADGLSLLRNDSELNLEEFVPRNPRQLIRAINNLKKNDRLYIRLYRNAAGAVVGGEGLPDLPPSLLALYNSRKATGNARPLSRVVYREHELPSQQLVVRGHQQISILIK